MRTSTFVVIAGLIWAVLIAWQSTPQAGHADTAGPDGSGYSWVDTNAPDPVTTFEWVDATDGTLLAISSEDDGRQTVNLPFTFNFFGTAYTQVSVATNGFLSFNTADPNGCNFNYNWGPGPVPDNLGSPIPHDDSSCASDGWGANPLIAAWFDDLSPSSCGDIYRKTTGTPPDRMFIVQFDGVCHFDCLSVCAPGEAITFQIILFEGSNDIKVQYLAAFFSNSTPDIAEENNGGTATTGISLDGATGLQYSWADPILTDGLAVLYSTSCPSDHDCDGVLDSPDLCPGTPTGEPVDENGCSDSQLTPTPTPTPTPTSTATATATATATPTPTATATPTPTATPTITDTDGDGFSDDAEVLFIGSDPRDGCADGPTDGANPADLNNDTFFTSADLSLIAGVIGLSVLPAPARRDIAPDTPDGFITSTDLSQVAARIGQSCAP